MDRIRASIYPPVEDFPQRGIPSVFSPELEFHVLELPKLHLATTDRQAKLERRARFLSATSVEELEELASEDATMNTAKKALEELSLDPEARRIAGDRETAVLMHRHLLAASREAGREEGEVALRGIIESMCEAFGIELSADRTQQLAKLDANELKSLADVILAERRWPSIASETENAR